MTYNVHQLLHLRDCVEDLGPLWSHSCFFFEDLNGDFRDLFHGTQNIDGQVHVIIIFIVYIPVDMNEKFLGKFSILYNCNVFYLRFYMVFLSYKSCQSWLQIFPISRLKTCILNSSKKVTTKG